MSFKIKYRYISEEARAFYEKDGGFINEDRALFKCFTKTNDGFGDRLITGIEMPGGFYEQIHRRLNIFVENEWLIPNKIHKNYIKTLSYLGVDACGINISLEKRYYKSKKYISDLHSIRDYILSGQPLFQFKPIQREGEEVCKFIPLEISQEAILTIKHTGRYSG